MRAVVFEAVGRVRVDDVPAPVIREPRDAIVRVSRAGICGSDLHFLHLKTPIDPGEVLGHEAVGIVESVGEGVVAVAPGDRVVVAFHIACGDCWFRNLGAGAFSGGLAGTQAERVRVPNADLNLLPVPAEIDDERAVFLGDVLTTGLYAASLVAPAKDEMVAVVGAGPVGFCAAQSLRAFGAQRVAMLDREPDRLALAEAAGAIAIDVGARNAQMAIADLTDDRGADAVLEAVGSLAAFETAVDVVRRGGRVVIAGIYAGETADVALGVYAARGLDLRFAGICPVHAFWERARDALLDGRVDPLPLVSHRLPLDEAAHGYDLFDRRVATKVLLEP
jgi:threonine dehydrogenase-like Zn-dependent dehydrogenase